jgi:phosphate transport system protein
MIAQLVAALRAHATLRNAFVLYNSMIEDVKKMYALAMNALRGEEPVEAVGDRLYALDREVNEKERTIRRLLVSHLALKAGQDAPACLVLMSVVKDAERLGDYCKNLFEVAEMFGQSLAQGRYMTPLVDISGKIKTLIARTGEAFIQSERTIAQSVVHESHTIASECDMILKQLIRDKLPTQKAVAYSLLSRYLKRLARHLGNIASSVLVGVDEIDFEGFVARAEQSEKRG